MLMKQLAEWAGYCCIREMLRNNARFRSSQVAAALGVDKSVVNYWKRKQKAGNLPLCPQCPTQSLPCKPLKSLASHECRGS